jgi:hydroxymethylpyrimidine kinase/phosphomethylpyrimidine kinase
MNTDKSTKATPPIALTIAGSDSGGGAGIQSDLNTFHANGVFGTSVITALTAQNTNGVQGVYPIPSNFVIEQLHSVLTDINVSVIKTGMLYSSDIIEALVLELKDKEIKIVVDPVMVSTSGSLLMKTEAVESLIEKLLPIAYIVTPNIPEANELLKHCIDSDLVEIHCINDMKQAAKIIATNFQPEYVLIKGGHLHDSSDAIDILYDRQQDCFQEFKQPFIQSTNTHGTGCSLSSAIAANLSKGYTTLQSVSNAKQYVFQAIQHGFRIGKGEIGTLNHML